MSRAFPLIVSYYTKNTLYQLEVQNLVASCKAWDLPIVVEGVDSLGSWELNCAYKPFFLHQKMQELRRPLLWVDADAVFVKKPEAIQAFSADIAVRINEGLEWTHPSKVMSGVVFVNCTQGAEVLIRLWAHECTRQLGCKERTQEFWDQIALRDVLACHAQQADVASLPASYTKIYDREGEAIVEHYQASRRLKKSVEELI